MTYLLQAFGHQVRVARDGAEGLARAQAEQPQVIICDVQIPKIDGFALVRQLKDDPSLRGVPVIAVTALAMVGDRDRILASGFDGYIAKPIEPEQFVRQVESFITRL
jgi:CheY-like chemotaxis protein